MCTFLTYIVTADRLSATWCDAEELSVSLSTVAKFLQSITMTELIEFLTVLLEYF